MSIVGQVSRKCRHRPIGSATAAAAAAAQTVLIMPALVLPLLLVLQAWSDQSVHRHGTEPDNLSLLLLLQA